MTRFEAGDELAPVARVLSRETIAAYADASGDRNPLHLDDDVARAAGFGTVLAHGMLTMGHLASAVSSWVGEAGEVLAVRAPFRAPVFAGEEVVARGRVSAVDEATSTVTLEVWVEVDRDGKVEYPVRRGEAVIRLRS